MNAPASDALLARRVAQLEAAFAGIAATRMAGLPLCNDALRVEAIGFARGPGPGENESGGLGVLLTPWCMNLIWLADDPTQLAAVGATRLHELAGERYAFIGAHEPAVGAFEMCSLYSPVFEFSAQQIAREVAEEVLRCLRRPVEKLQQPSRRSFLLRPPPAGTAFGR